MKRPTCPHCQTKMDIMAFLKSTTPWHLNCADCKTKLRLKKYEFEAFLIAVAMGVLTLTVPSRIQATSLTYAVVLTVLVVGFEYLFFCDRS